MKASLSDEVIASIVQRWKEHSAEIARGSSTADALYATLESAILAKEIPPGVPLREELLGSIFSVSRTPVREVLVRLVSTGLLTRDERGRLCVEEITAERVLEVYTVRTTLEGLCARVCAQVQPRALVGQLEKFNDLMLERAGRGDYDGAAAANISFHAAIANGTRNQVLIDFMSTIHSWVGRIANTTLSTPGRAEEAHGQHRQIIDAIRNHQPEAAEKAALTHMKDAEQIRLTMIEEAELG